MKTFKEDIKENHTELEGLDARSGGLDEDISFEEIALSIGEQKINVRKDYARISEVMDVIIEKDETVTEIPLNELGNLLTEKDKKVNSFEIIGYVVEYMNIHKGVFNKEKDIPEKPLKTTVLSDITSKEDANFIDKFDKKINELYALIETANYLNIQGLLHLACAKIATFIKGKSLEEIQKILDPYGDSGKDNQSENKDVKS